MKILDQDQDVLVNQKEGSDSEQDFSRKLCCKQQSEARATQVTQVIKTLHLL